MISVCTLTARKGFIEYQAQCLANQTVDKKDLVWILVDFAYEERSKMVKDLAKDLCLNIVHVPNVRTDKRLFFRDIARNRNKALALAAGLDGGTDAIFMDDYCLVPPEFVEKHVQLLSEGHVSVGMMYRIHTNIDMGIHGKDCQNLIKEILDNRHGAVLKDDRNGIGDIYACGMCTYTGNLGLPKKVYLTLNGFDPRMESGLEDCDIGMRLHFCGFKSYFTPFAYTINMDGNTIPYCYQFDHNHDVEPFICNEINKFAGNDKLSENEFMTVEFFENYRIATCKICGATGMIDPRELMRYKRNVNEFRVPNNLPGGFDEYFYVKN